MCIDCKQCELLGLQHVFFLCSCLIHVFAILLLARILRILNCHFFGVSLLVVFGSSPQRLNFGPSAFLLFGNLKVLYLYSYCSLFLLAQTQQADQAICFEF